MNARTLFILVLVGILWGASYVFTKVAIAETSVLTLVTIQTFIGGVAIFAYMRARQVPFIATSGLWPKAAGMALLNTIIPLLLVAWAVIRIDAGVAAVLNATMPLFAALFSALLLADERLNLSRAGGLIVGFAGVIVFTNGDIFNLNDSNVVAELAVIAAAASWGLNAVYARVVIRTEDPLTLTGTYFMMAVVILSAILLIFDWPPDARMSAKAWACIASAGALSGALAYILFLWLLPRIGAVRAALTSYIVPVAGLFLGWLFLEEKVGVSSVIGTAIIISGVALVLQSRAATPELQLEPETSLPLGVPAASEPAAD